MSRLKKLRSSLDEKELDGLLVAGSQNRRYLSNFTGSDGWLLVTQERAILAVDSRYTEQAGLEAAGWDVFQIKGKITDWLPGLIADAGTRRTGFESDLVSVATYNLMVDAIKQKQMDIRLTPSPGIVETLRAVKDEEELGRIRKAIKITEAVLSEVPSMLEEATTEKDLAWKIEEYMRKHGSEPVPFDVIVASGARSAMPHATPAEEVIQPGQALLIDIGARIEGYCSDMTRTFFVGEPDAAFRTQYDVVLAAQLTALSMLRSGMTGNDADAIARAIIDEAGFGDLFGHSLGHGVGLAVHEKPVLGARSTDVLTDGMVFTIEPGVYKTGFAGVRIENMVVLTDGKPELLTRLPVSFTQL